MEQHAVKCNQQQQNQYKSGKQPEISFYALMTRKVAYYRRQELQGLFLIPPGLFSLISKSTANRRSAL